MSLSFESLPTIFIVLHVLSVVCGMGAAVVADILALRFGYNRTFSREEAATLHTLARIVTIALVCIVATGLSMISLNPEHYLTSTKFLVKMTVVGVLSINGFALHQYVLPYIGVPHVLTSPAYRRWRKVSFALGAISVTSWISALVLGLSEHVPFSYMECIVGYAVVLTIAVITSQAIEQRALETRNAVHE